MSKQTHHVVSYSGGLASFYAAKRAVDRYGVGRVTLLFTDTLIEDEDLYRFLDESSAYLGAPLVKLADGRTPWDVFKDERFLGNSRVAPCSKILKRELATAWMREHYPDPSRVILHLGMSVEEIERLKRARRQWLPYRVHAPLMWRPLASHADMTAALAEAGIEIPRLYKMGFPHNNCGGGCVRAGAKEFRRLLAAMPCRFAEWERREQEMRDFLGKDVTILRRTRGGERQNITLRQLREGVEAGTATLFEDEESRPGCGCFIDDAG